MVTYEQAKAIAIANTIPDGKLYYAGDAGTFYIFRVVPKDFPMNLKGAMFGTSIPAVDKKDGRFWISYINDPNVANAKKLFPT